MRVIAGEFRGRKLQSFEGRDIRPTADRVKESLFNILGEGIIESNFLDLFGGSGSIGIEAYSRGAAQVVFIDDSEKSIKLLKQNLEHIGILDKAEVYSTDYETAISRLSRDNRRFDIIFIDPPYNKGLAQKSLVDIEKFNILADNGIIVVEHDITDIMPEQVGTLVRFREKKYGTTILTFYNNNILPT